MVTFNYDTNANLLSITKLWNGQEWTWATFGWGNHNLSWWNFSGVTVVGGGGAYASWLPVVTQVALVDGNRYDFEYTNTLQASVIRRSWFEDPPLSYAAFDYAPATSDCPRLSASRVWAHNWTGINGVPSEVTTQYSLPGDGSHQLTAPDGTIYKEFYGTGWQRGLNTLSEVWSGGVKQKWTTTDWEQDDPGVYHQLNPRIKETNVYDAALNRRRKVIEYNAYAPYGLPHIIRDYAANGPEIKHTFIDYNLSQAYLDRYIIGLVSAVHTSDTVNWETKTTYTYDEPANIEALPATATQHDPSYGVSFTTRGNVTSKARWDATDKDNPDKTVATGIKYNTTGSVIRETDPSGHQNNISYADSFSDDNNSRNTFAYPTTVTDADGFSSFVQYNFDHGARTRTQGPPPANQPQGIIQTLLYDAAGRLDRVTTTNNGAYTRYVYNASNVMSFSTVNNIADDAYAIQVLDGLGRVVGTAGYHPGSAGGYKAQNTIHDLMGRAIKQSNPTEIDVNWVPAGDDAGPWKHTEQTYDWNGRPLRTTHPDTTFREASYAGCGCAGDAVVTLTDEGTLDGGVPKRRQQKIYSDVLGRTVKTEVLNWQGGSPYLTTVTTYNMRDQVKQVRQWAGAEGAGTYQDTTMTYDGHGRLKTRHVPEQNVGAATTWDYNPDDTIQKITDARGASQTLGYNNRHLVTSVTSTLTGLSPITVTHGYDDARNRSSMSHTVGGLTKDSASFSYDQLSRLTSETRHINALESYGPNYGNFTIGYGGYTLSSELQSITDPFNSTTNFSYDNVGRTISVTGSYSGTNYTYANNVVYRAWDSVKSASVGGVLKTISYNSRVKPTQYRLTAGSTNMMRFDYSYFDDGRLKEIKDLDDQIGDPHFVQFHYMSRAYSYDQAGRVSSVGQLPNYNVIPPFTGNYAYDAFNNLTSRTGQYALNSYQSDSATYANNKRNGWNYNAEGRITSSSDSSDSGGSSTRAWTYDASGALATTSETRNGQTSTNNLAYDGDGELLYESINASVSDYLIRSTVLGTVLTKLTSTGGKDITYVPTNGLVAAMQNQNPGFTPFMSWVHRDALGIQEHQSNAYYNLNAYDPFGSLIPNTQPPLSGPPPYVPFYGATYGGLSWSTFTNANNFSQGCVWDGQPVDCNKLKQHFNDGWLQLNVPGGLTESTRFVPQRPDGYFAYREGDQKHEFFITGPLFSDPEPQNPSTPVKVFNKFLAQNPNCAKKIQAAGDKLGLGDYRKTPWNITDTLPVYDQPGVIPNQTDARNSIPRVFFEEKHPSYNAVTFTRIENGEVIRGGTYLGEGYHYSYIGIDKAPYFRRANNSDRVKGSTLVDESLHNYFGVDHADLTKYLGIDSTGKNPAFALKVWIRGGCK